MIIFRIIESFFKIIHFKNIFLFFFYIYIYKIMNNKINNFFLYEKPRNLKNKFNIVEEYIIFFFFFLYRINYC